MFKHRNNNSTVRRNQYNEQPQYLSGKRRDRHAASYSHQELSDSNTWTPEHTDKDLVHPGTKTPFQKQNV